MEDQRVAWMAEVEVWVVVPPVVMAVGGLVGMVMRVVPMEVGGRVSRGATVVELF